MDSVRNALRFAVGLALLIGSIPAASQQAPAKTLATNSEMTAIFEADQAARKGRIDWVVVREDDRKRRLRTQELLDAGQLRAADDFYHAAFVFQHSGQASDHLKAHALAVIAIARGKPEAAWIAAATLDRYLQNIGQPQIYGTQYLRRDHNWTQEPYQRDLLSDPLREAAGVPPVSKQGDKLKQLQAQEAEESKQGGESRPHE